MDHCLPWLHLGMGLLWVYNKVLPGPLGCLKEIHQQLPCSCNRPWPTEGFLRMEKKMDDKIAWKLTPDGSFSARRSWDFTRKDWYNWGPLERSQATDIASLHGLRFTTVFPLRRNAGRRTVEFDWAKRKLQKKSFQLVLTSLAWRPTIYGITKNQRAHGHNWLPFAGFNQMDLSDCKMDVAYNLNSTRSSAESTVL
ncbi:hypothetical protein NC653_041139 [Populus alba x Populus x berolinensis]|uniref:Uncharacterized protein n=1 Tax=Populus alba x Populus x berolinensis TaxID=444605 RepID=A0AAD6L7U6_9ROSI|nr:hypothetical protein NC653_041139 [Populus alba x Populus x berolinensis]